MVPASAQRSELPGGCVPLHRQPDIHGQPYAVTHWHVHRLDTTRRVDDHATDRCQVRARSPSWAEQMRSAMACGADSPTSARHRPHHRVRQLRVLPDHRGPVRRGMDLLRHGHPAGPADRRFGPGPGRWI